jgi:hypothetical protein
MAAAWINTKQLSCEIARIRTRAIHLTTGTFNLVCQRPNRIPRLSGRLSVPNGSWKFCHMPKAHSYPQSVGPRNRYTLQAAPSGVNPLLSQDFHLFSTDSRPINPATPPSLGRLSARDSTVVARSRFKARSRTSSSARLNPVPHELAVPIGLKPTRKTTVHKRSIGGSCENAQTLRGSLSPNSAPWPGRLFVLFIRCRTSVGRPKIKRPA